MSDKLKFIFSSTYSDYLKVDIDEARLIGQKLYWNGKECNHGHVTWRRVENHTCIICKKESSIKASYKKEFGEKADEYAKYRSKIEDILEQRKLERELNELELIDD